MYSVTETGSKDFTKSKHPFLDLWTVKFLKDQKIPHTLTSFLLHCFTLRESWWGQQSKRGQSNADHHHHHHQHHSQHNHQQPCQPQSMRRYSEAHISLWQHNCHGNAPFIDKHFIFHHPCIQHACPDDVHTYWISGSHPMLWLNDVYEDSGIGFHKMLRGEKCRWCIFPLQQDDWHHTETYTFWFCIMRRSFSLSFPVFMPSGFVQYSIVSPVLIYGTYMSLYALLIVMVSAPPGRFCVLRSSLVLHHMHRMRKDHVMQNLCTLIVQCTYTAAFVLNHTFHFWKVWLSTKGWNLQQAMCKCKTVYVQLAV